MQYIPAYYPRPPVAACIASKEVISFVNLMTPTNLLTPANLLAPTVLGGGVFESPLQIP